MDRLDVSTVVYVPRKRAFEFLLDFPGYAGYTDLLREVRQYGDGSADTRYELVLSWWLLTYRVTSEVTAVERPDRIEWSVRDFDIDGSWQVERVPDADLDGHESGSRIRLVADVDRDALDDGSLDLPRLVSVEGLLDRLVPHARSELDTIATRVVADLEGEPRSVDLTVHKLPDFVEERGD